jgi:hypothetical protein
VKNSELQPKKRKQGEIWQLISSFPNQSTNQSTNQSINQPIPYLTLKESVNQVSPKPKMLKNL